MRWSILGVLTGIILLTLAQQIFFPVISFKRTELLGAKLGASKQQVMRILGDSGVDDVLPELVGYPVITRKNIAQLQDLDAAPGICVSDYKNSKSAKFNFDSNNGPVGLVHASVKEFAALSPIKTRSELLEKLRELLSDEAGVEVFACIASSRWVRLKSGITDKDTALLLNYDAWTINVPGGYSTAQLQFADGRLSEINYRWRLFESL